MERSLVPSLATMEALAPLTNDSIMSGRLLQSFKHLKHQNLSTGDDSIHSSGIICLVQFFTTKKVLAPHSHDPIMSERLIWSLRHLKHQNLSTCDDFIYSSVNNFLVV